MVAPHPDDETIGAGGLIAHCAQARHPVEVLFLTNGDGWPWALEAAFHVKHPRAADYLRLGSTRQREALLAARRLGVPVHAVRFLGFPDDGLTALWSTDWNEPYRSPRTRERTPPYPGVVDPHALYTGAALHVLLQEELVRFKPTVVVVPHPGDNHPDHALAARFVLSALDALRKRTPGKPPPLVLTYLVHEGNWPPPGADGPLPAPAEPRFGDARWVTWPLTEAELEVKTAALQEHASQLAASRELLLRFLRRNEVFGALPPAK